MIRLDTDILWWSTCRSCSGGRNRPGGHCEDCCDAGEVPDDLSWCVTLVHNLAIAGALFTAAMFTRTK